MSEWLQEQSGAGPEFVQHFLARLAQSQTETGLLSSPPLRFLFHISFLERSHGCFQMSLNMSLSQSWLLSVC